MTRLHILTIVAAAALATPALAQSYDRPGARAQMGYEAGFAARGPAWYGARAQGDFTGEFRAPGVGATGQDYIGTDPDPNVRFELHRDPTGARQ